MNIFTLQTKEHQDSKTVMASTVTVGATQNEVNPSESESRHVHVDRENSCQEGPSDILTRLGGFSWFQLRVIPLFCLCNMCASWQYMGIVFLEYTPEHRCFLPNWENDTTQDEHGVWINVTAPRWRNNQTDRCIMGNNTGILAAHIEVPCTSWIYSKKYFDETYPSEFNLVCGDSGKVTLTTVSFLLGCALGTGIAGWISDRIGRRITIGCALLLQCASGIGVAFAPDVDTIMVLRFFLGAGAYSAYITSFTFGMEVVCPPNRMAVGILMHGSYAAGTCTIPLISYLLRHWRYIQIATTAPAALLVLYTWATPESLRWLMSKDKHEEALKVAKYIAKVNGRPSPAEHDVIESHVERDSSETTGGILRDLLQTPKLILHAIILSINWAIIDISWYGVGLNSVNIGGSIFLNFFLIGVMELPSTVITTFINRCGRKVLLVGAMVTAGLTCLSSIFAEFHDSDDSTTTKWIRVGISSLGKLLLSVANNVIYIHGAEIYPTVIRNIGIASSVLVSKVLSILTPVIVREGNSITPFQGEEVLPLVIFGSMTLLGGIMALLLPETANRPLPQKIQDTRHRKPNH